MNDRTKGAAADLESPFLNEELPGERPEPEANEEPVGAEAAAGAASRGEEEGGGSVEEQGEDEWMDGSEAEVSEECEDELPSV